MDIRLNIETKIDLNESIKKIKWIGLDFSSVHLLQGNKDLLEESFQNTKEELIYG